MNAFIWGDDLSNSNKDDYFPIVQTNFDTRYSSVQVDSSARDLGYNWSAVSISNNRLIIDDSTLFSNPRELEFGNFVSS